ncbi:Brachyury protein, partial [Stegodyphus mimosarum]
MFPSVQIDVKGLDVNSLYSFMLEFVQVSGKKLRYVSGFWTENGKSETPTTQATYMHEQNIKLGSHWMKTPVSFEKIKITNQSNNPTAVLLNSLCRYYTRIYIRKIDGNVTKAVKIVDLHLTEFVTVTAYQNVQVTMLKCFYNKNAKG